MAGIDAPRPTGIGAQRRLRALASRGWSRSAIVRTTRLTVAEIRSVMESPERVPGALAIQVSHVYDRLWDLAPPGTTALDRTAARAARGAAARHGWAPPMAYDDDRMDSRDYDVNEAPHWQRTGVQRRGSDLAEDMAWIRAEGGYQHATLADLAYRLGTSEATLQQAMRRRREAERHEQADHEAEDTG